MTNEEAIEFLKIIVSRYPSSLETTFNDECELIALNMAIKALEERSQGEWVCPTCKLYDKTVYCQYSGEFTDGITKCKYYKKSMKGGAE